MAAVAYQSPDGDEGVASVSERGSKGGLVRLGGRGRHGGRERDHTERRFVDERERERERTRPCHATPVKF